MYFFTSYVLVPITSVVIENQKRFWYKVYPTLVVETVLLGKVQSTHGDDIWRLFVRCPYSIYCIFTL